jgi:hypothetical protein
VRPILALVAAAIAAAFGAQVLGEYQLTLLTGIAAGVGVGFLLAELVLALGRRRGVVQAAVAAVLAAGCVWWAAWIDSGEGLQPIRGTAWLAVVLAAATTAARLRPTS